MHVWWWFAARPSLPQPVHLCMLGHAMLFNMALLNEVPFMDMRMFDNLLFVTWDCVFLTGHHIVAAVLLPVLSFTALRPPVPFSHTCTHIPHCSYCCCSPPSLMWFAWRAPSQRVMGQAPWPLSVEAPWPCWMQVGALLLATLCYSV
jgi:hypothetical protein